MKTLSNWLAHVNQLDTTVNSWLVGNSHTLLRVGTGLIFLELGLLKFFLGGSFVDDMATYLLTNGVLSVQATTLIVVLVECVTGLCFINHRFLRLGVWLLSVQLIGAVVPFILFSNDLLRALFSTPTLLVQYISTEVLLVAAGLFIAANWTKAQPDAKTDQAWA